MISDLLLDLLTLINALASSIDGIKMLIEPLSSPMTLK